MRISVPDTAFGPEEFAEKTGVSRETLSRLKAHADLLADWNARHNLVSARSLEDVWRRHFWDSAQLAPLIPAQAQTLVDLGSGAGFPGLVLAEMLRLPDGGCRAAGTDGQDPQYALRRLPPSGL
jgi:16S rRNA (guanine527-N7)-methyltransferase